MNKLRVIIPMLTMVFSVYGFIGDVYAQFGGGSSSASGGLNYNPAPITIPSYVPPPWYPHGFPKVWTTEDVINALNERGIEVNKIIFETKGSEDNLPASAKEMVKFSTGEEWEGIILSFELKDSLNKVRKHYLGLNKRGEKYTWSFVRENILLVLPGTIGEDKARQYKDALNRMKVE